MKKTVGLKKNFGISQSSKNCPDAPIELNQNIALVLNAKKCWALWLGISGLLLSPPLLKIFLAAIAAL